jgi:hypothetical protein
MMLRRDPLLAQVALCQAPGETWDVDGGHR